MRYFFIASFYCGTWSRTKTDGFRDRCSAIKLSRTKEENYSNFDDCRQPSISKSLQEKEAQMAVIIAVNTKTMTAHRKLILSNCFSRFNKDCW